MPETLTFHFLAFCGLGDVYLHGDAISLSQRGPGGQVPRPVATLAGEAASVSHRLQTRRAAAVPAALLRAHAHLLAHCGELAFVHEALIPYLAERAGHSDAGACPAALRALLREVQGLVRAVAPDAAIPARPAIPASLLGSLFKAPSVITEGQVIPLRRAGLLNRKTAAVVLDSVPYDLGHDESEPLTTVMHRAWTACEHAFAQAHPVSPVCPEAMNLLAARADDVLAYRRPAARDGYYVLYRDRDHAVQYKDGRCALVRGPLCPPGCAESFYVGLAVKGTSREALLANTPRSGGAPDLMWCAENGVDRRGICMGSRTQYNHLLDGSFSVAESLCHLLDAARIIWTKLVRRRPGSFPRGPARRPAGPRSIPTGGVR
jgi:hypothetical protein